MLTRVRCRFPIILLYYYNIILYTNIILYIIIVLYINIIFYKLQQKEDEVNTLKTEAARLNRMRETIQRKLRTVEDHKSEVEQSKETLKGNITALERELESARKQAEMDKKAIDDLVRERDILNKNMLKAAAATQKQLNLVKLHEQSKKTLEQEIQNYKEEVRLRCCSVDWKLRRIC